MSRQIQNVALTIDSIANIFKDQAEEANISERTRNQNLLVKYFEIL